MRRERVAERPRVLWRSKNHRGRSYKDQNPRSRVRGPWTSDDAVQRIGERLFLPLAVRRLPSSNLPLLAQFGEQVARRQPITHVALVKLTPSRVQRRHTFLDQPIGQGHVAADHQFARRGVVDQVIISRIHAAGHHDQPHTGKGRLALRLARHHHHLEFALEGKLDDQVLGRLGAGVGIDPYTHRETPRNQRDYAHASYHARSVAKAGAAWPAQGTPALEKWRQRSI